MTKVNLKETIPDPQTWNQVWNDLKEISDESGESDLGEGYLLKYEGWGGICVEEVWAKVGAEQTEKGIDVKSEEAQEERESACYQSAEEQSYRIIDNEWKHQLRQRGYSFIDGGYNPGGLYGRTWAIFRKGV